MKYIGLGLPLGQWGTTGLIHVGGRIVEVTPRQYDVWLFAMTYPVIEYVEAIPEDELGRLLESCVSAGVGLKVAEGEEWAKLSPLRVIPRVAPSIPLSPDTAPSISYPLLLEVEMEGGTSPFTEDGGVDVEKVALYAKKMRRAANEVELSRDEYVLFCEFDGVRTLGEALGRARRSGARLGEAEAAAFTARLKRNNFVYLDVEKQPADQGP